MGRRDRSPPDAVARSRDARQRPRARAAHGRGEHRARPPRARRRRERGGVRDARDGTSADQHPTPERQGRERHEGHLRQDRRGEQASDGVPAVRAESRRREVRAALGAVHGEGTHERAATPAGVRRSRPTTPGRRGRGRGVRALNRRDAPGDAIERDARRGVGRGRFDRGRRPSRGVARRRRREEEGEETPVFTAPVDAGTGAAGSTPRTGSFGNLEAG